MNLRRWVLLPLLTTPALAGAMLAYQVALRKAWVPFDGPLVFLHYRFPQVHTWWLRFAAIEAVWNIAFIAAIVYAPAVARMLGRRFLLAVLALQALALAVLVCTPIPLDSDQYAYAYYGSLVERGMNPYIQYARPLKLTSAESRIATHWHNPPVPDRYGPAWTLGNAVALFPFEAAGASAKTFALRVLAGLAALACTLLLWSAVRGRPWGPCALAAFAANPLVLLSEGTGAHNDIYMVFWGLLAYTFAARRWFEASGAALAIAITVKFAYLPLVLPLSGAVYALGSKWQRAATTALAFVATLMIFAAPFGVRLSLVNQVLFQGDNLPYFSYMLWRVAYHLGLHAQQRTFAAAFPAFVMVCSFAVTLLAVRKRREPLLEILLFAGILFVPYKVESWYGVMLTPMLLVPSRWAVPVFAGISIGCELLQQRIFTNHAEPYVEFFGIAVATALVMYYWIRRTTVSTKVLRAYAA